jgi:uncharacterized membrane protein YgcG
MKGASEITEWALLAVFVIVMVAVVLVPVNDYISKTVQGACLTKAISPLKSMVGAIQSGKSGHVVVEAGGCVEEITIGNDAAMPGRLECEIGTDKKSYVGIEINKANLGVFGQDQVKFYEVWKKDQCIASSATITPVKGEWDCGSYSSGTKAKIKGGVGKVYCLTYTSENDRQWATLSCRKIDSTDDECAGGGGFSGSGGSPGGAGASG